MLMFLWFVVVAAAIAYRVEIRHPIHSTDLPWWRTRIDVYAAHWPTPLYWSYLVAKWYLAAMGGFALTMYYLHRLGLPSLWPT